MREKPIIFSAPMVRAILEGRKTMTRRVLKPQPQGYGDLEVSCLQVEGRDRPQLAYGRVITKQFLPVAVGDRLWVKHPADCFPVYLKPIPGWETLYAAGTDGLIYRADGDPTPLKGTPSNRGYLTVSLSDGDWHTKNVHRLVCETFYGPPPAENWQVRHMDGDRLNNRPDNLDWGSQEDNWQDRKAHGRGMGESHHAAKLSDDDVASIRESYVSQRKLAARYGVAQSTISDIRNGHKRLLGHEAAPRNYPPFSLWRSPIHMPRWASRITLEVIGVKVQRLQEISEAEAEAEGVEKVVHRTWWDYVSGGKGPSHVVLSPCESYRTLWESLHGPGAWEANPWVAAITFQRVADV